MRIGEPAFSLIIPAYNEEQRLPSTLQQVYQFCEAQDDEYEVIVVDDGSTDLTRDIVSRAASTWPNLRLVLGPHRGKGGAIRAGVLAAQGRFVAVADADMSMPIQEFAKFDTFVFSQCEVAIATREGPDAHRFNESILRHVMGRVFNAFVQLMVLPGIRDTQCGFKVMPRQVALQLCRYQTIDGWGFDVEWLVIALQNGYRVGEIPIDWYHDGKGSRISPLKDSVRMLSELWRIHGNMVKGRYDPAPGDREKQYLPAVDMATTLKRAAVRIHE